MAAFKEETGNQQFTCTFLTWANLAILLIGYPLLSLLGGGTDSTSLLKLIGSNQTLLMVALISTIILQWFIFGVNYGALYHEGTRLAGIGLRKIKGIHFAWAAAFLLASNAILAGLAWFLAQIGLPMPGEIGLLIPTEPSGKVVWVVVSFTAGFCEEVAFRGYLMTRLRILLKCKTWLVPTVVSALTFGICHAYQGWPGLIVISTYGILFSLLYIRTGSLWPCIIAHFFQDFSALFIPQ
jgi:membrane protease YdiL (CAAX protease family)